MTIELITTNLKMKEPCPINFTLTYINLLLNIAYTYNTNEYIQELLTITVHYKQN